MAFAGLCLAAMSSDLLAEEVMGVIGVAAPRSERSMIYTVDIRIGVCMQRDWLKSCRFVPN